jgi:hypothetical protein
MRLGDIRREDVLGAIALLDDPSEGPKLAKRLRYGPATDYRLLHKGKFYDSKPVIGIAHGLSPVGEFVSGRDLQAGQGGAARVLRRLGFYVDEGALYDITQLRVDRTHGRPAPYQYVVLLWAIARARSGGPRMVPFNDARDELAQILAPFAVAQTPPDPAMPWFALRNSSWWELQVPTTPSGLTDADVQRLNLVAGLSESRYDRLRDDAAFASAAVDVIGRIIGEEPGYDQLLSNLRLPSSTGEVNWAPTQHEDASANFGTAEDSPALIVTWNPDKGKWAKMPQGYYYAVEQTARRQSVMEDWSTGVRNHGVYWGDRAFLLRQGNQGKGLIASGTVRGEIRQIPHWDPENHPGEIANTVDIEWECVLPVEDILPKEELEQRLPEIYWSPAGSGVLIEGESADQLVRLWSNHLVRIGRSGSLPVENPIANSVESAINPRRKFGRRFTAEENAAIEERAVFVTRERFEEKGYETKDVGAYESYDVHATKDQEVVKVEVKGTTTDGAAVVLTRNEVNLHRLEHPHNALAVVRNITLDRSGDRPVATGGELKLEIPWEINEDGLSPIAYDYRTGI